MLQSRKKAENENVLKSDTMLKIRIENEEKCVEFLTEAEKTGQRKRAEWRRIISNLICDSSYQSVGQL